ncbi:MAG: hypothetical protein JW806_00650 [Sedimentisphaerales bacterium]|nr:hypothetical protein [Sedimentisphaerales bacterium]
MIIEQIAELVFNRFSDSDIVLAILDRDGSFIANDPEVFGRVFPSGRMLGELCDKIDDGCEPLISQVDGHFVAASGISANLNSIGYAVILLPADNPEKSIEYHDFIEIILEQFSLIASLVLANHRLANHNQAQISGLRSEIFASVN